MHVPFSLTVTVASLWNACPLLSFSWASIHRVCNIWHTLQPPRARPKPAKAARRTTEAPRPTRAEWLGSSKTAAHRHAQWWSRAVEWEDCWLLGWAEVSHPSLKNEHDI